MANKLPSVPADGADKPTLYLVRTTLHHDGVEYDPGDDVTLGPGDAQTLMALGVIEPYPSA